MSVQRPALDELLGLLREGDMVLVARCREAEASRERGLREDSSHRIIYRF